MFNVTKALMNSLLDRLDKIEERLARLEEHKHDNADGAINMKYPSKPIEPMATYSEHGVEIGKPEKTVAEALSIGHLSDIGAFKQKGAKPKPVTEEKPKEEVVGVFSCPRCGFCSSIVRRDGRIGMKDDKPSECCSCKKPGQTIWVDNLKNPVCKDCHKPVFSKSEFISIPRSMAERMLAHFKLPNKQGAYGNVFAEVLEQSLRS